MYLFVNICLFYDSSRRRILIIIRILQPIINFPQIARYKIYRVPTNVSK